MDETQSERNQMSLKIRLARAGTKKRPVYHIVIADSRAPRDGRFIERLGYFTPLLPKDKTERLKLDLDKVKAWLAKGARPTDRVLRFLDQAGLMKREKRNNPLRAVPRKERKAQAEEAAAAAAAPKPAAPAAAAPAAAAPTDAAPAAGELTRWIRRRGGAHLRGPDRRSAWASRRGEAQIVHRRSHGAGRLRAADERRRLGKL